MTMTDLLDRFGVDYAAPGSTPHVRPGYLGVVCPFCGRGSSNYGLGYNLDKRFWTCWKCGPKKTAEVLGELLPVSPGDLKKLLKDLRGGAEFPVVPQEVRTGKYRPPPTMPLGKQHRNYLRRRGFDPELLETTWDLRGITLHYTLAWRIFIPVHLDGEPVSWTTRGIGIRQRRYWSAAPEQESVHHKHLLYGEDYVRHTVVVHEGPADVWATGPGSVATFGTNYTRAQVLRLSRFPVRYVCFDSEPKAQEQARRLCDELSVFPGSTHRITLDTGKDSASASEKERKLLRRLLK